MKTAPLATRALSVCNRCGAPIWTYSTLAGNRVELDSVPGPYVVDANDAVFLTTSNDGYAAHQDRCSQIAAAPLSAPIRADEMLWP